jgi:predicted metal-dependent hydrolase
LPYGSAGVEPVSEEPLPPHKTISAAHELLVEGRPFSAHEVYEARWKAGPTTERDLWQGLAQLCVGVTHAERGNRTGALRLIGRARRRLETYISTGGPSYGLDLEQLIEWIREREREPDGTSWLVHQPL